MSVAWLLLAQTKAISPPVSPALTPASVRATIMVAVAFVAAIVLGLIVISLLGRWRKQAAPAVFDPKDQLIQFQQLYEKGELSQEEFDRIRDRLGRQLFREPSASSPAPVESLKAEQPAKDGSPPTLPNRSQGGPSTNQEDSTDAVG